MRAKINPGSAWCVSSLHDSNSIALSMILLCEPTWPQQRKPTTSGNAHHVAQLRQLDCGPSYHIVSCKKRPRALVVGRYSKFLRFDLIWSQQPGQRPQPTICPRRPNMTCVHAAVAQLCCVDAWACWCIQGDHLSGKPGNVGEFDSCQWNVRDFTLSGEWSLCVLWVVKLLMCMFRLASAWLSSVIASVSSVFMVLCIFRNFFVYILYIFIVRHTRVISWYSSSVRHVLFAIAKLLF